MVLRRRKVGWFKVPPCQAFRSQTLDRETAPFFSRCVWGWLLAHAESATRASELIAQAFRMQADRPEFADRAGRSSAGGYP